MKEVEELGVSTGYSREISDTTRIIMPNGRTGHRRKIIDKPIQSSIYIMAIKNKGSILSDDEVKYLMRTYFKIPRNEQAKFPYRGHDDYFYKGLRVKATVGPNQQNGVNQLPQVTGSMSPIQ
jgi:hypothetical protein